MISARLKKDPWLPKISPRPGSIAEVGLSVSLDVLGTPPSVRAQESSLLTAEGGRAEGQQPQRLSLCISAVRGVEPLSASLLAIMSL